MERQKEEIEEYERVQRLKEDKLVREQERRELRVEEARLRNEIHEYVSGLISKNFETDLNLRELRTQMGPKAMEEDYVSKMQGWVSLLSDEINVHVQDHRVSFTGDNLDEGKKERLNFSNAYCIV